MIGVQPSFHDACSYGHTPHGGPHAGPSLGNMFPQPGTLKFECPAVSSSTLARSSTLLDPARSRTRRFAELDHLLSDCYLSPTHITVRMIHSLRHRPIRRLSRLARSVP